MKHIFFIALLIVFQYNIFASDASSNSSVQTPIPSYSGPFSYIEYSFGDAVSSRYRLHFEYLVGSSLALGGSLEYGNPKYNVSGYDDFLIGWSITQYLQSLRLRYLFFRYEVLASYTNYYYNEEIDNSYKKHSHDFWGLELGVDSGYRVVFLKYLSSSIGIGLRRKIPDFFENKMTDKVIMFSKNESLWRIRIEATLGVNL